ncbi:MAG: hypothetical protein IAE98_03220 [Candidatus Kapabacteria bacterium]|nr:hypothetical protein [Candidatus Kapabacteria bacterium]
MTKLAIEVQSMLMSGITYEEAFEELNNTYQSPVLVEIFNEFRSNYIDDFQVFANSMSSLNDYAEFAAGYANNIKVLCEKISTVHIDEAPHDNHIEHTEDCDKCMLESIDYNNEQKHLHSYYGATR